MKKNEQDMSFLDHLEILRWHLIRSGIAILILSILAFIFKEIIFDAILLAPKDPNFLTYRFLCNISQEHLKHVNNYIDRTEQQQFQSDSRETLMELFEEDELGERLGVDQERMNKYREDKGLEPR